MEAIARIAETRRIQLVVRGVVQGVGFRPFVWRLANELALTGWVRNDADGVYIQAEGSDERLRALVEKLQTEHPPLASVETIETTNLANEDSEAFEIHESKGGPPTTLVLPDLATCPLCVADVFSPGNRRFRYPFTNCTNCGPRYTIIESLPYDRRSTSMKTFALCAACRAEYEDPSDRRFHAQPNACPECGPHLEIRDAEGVPLSWHDDALRTAAEVVRLGGVLALKGLGGFHLIADARSDAALSRLRLVKSREEKPFALMYPTMQAIEDHCRVSNLERRLLTSAQAPIVLVRRKARHSLLSDLVAPGNPYLGVMIPYTPLHHLLMAELGFPVVATSGNRADEPICTDENEALERLRGIADFFLVHDRPIVRHVDDSVVAVMGSTPTLIRRSRGWAPLPVATVAGKTPLLAVGGHLKNSVAMARQGRVFLSQHIGDLDTPEALEAFRATADSLQHLYDQQPHVVVRDLHPNYASSSEAGRFHLPELTVQHHHAHVASCMAEHGLEGELLGVAWDGSGWGPDGTVWGGEILVADRRSFRRIAHLRTFPLPGGEKAVREPRRSALGILWEIFGEAAFELPAIENAFSEEERRVLLSVLGNERLSPRTSSAGRLFDAVAFLTGGRAKTSFEGQAAMELEWSIEDTPEESRAWSTPLRGDQSAASQAAGARASSPRRDDPADPPPSPLIADWEPMVRAILDELARGTSRQTIANRFHTTLANLIAEIAKTTNQTRVVLTGGCFQNRVLLARASTRLQSEGFEVFTHSAVPPNDGGIAVGQIAVGAKLLEEGTH